MNQLIEAQNCYAIEIIRQQHRPDITVGENLDEQIVAAEKYLNDLRATKDRMKSTGLLDVRIADLQVAMCF